MVGKVNGRLAMILAGSISIGIGYSEGMYFIVTGFLVLSVGLLLYYLNKESGLK